MKNKTVRLTESAVMLALAAILSILPILELPYGGSITVCSMLPICIIAYRYGVAWGMFTGTVYGILQMFLGLKNVLWFSTPLSVIAVIVLDYLLAFAVMGLAGAFRRHCKQAPAMMLGTLLACVARYLSHFVAGITVWKGFSIPDEAAVLYSFAYNATYMLPETVVLLAGLALIAGMLDFGKDTVGRRTGEHGSFDWLAAGAGVSIVAALILDVREIFQHLQDGETGDFIITGLVNVNWGIVGIFTAVGIVLATACLLIRAARKRA